MERARDGLHLLLIFILRARPEETSQPVFRVSRHHVCMQVRHALTHGVVHRNEAALRLKHFRHCFADDLDSAKEGFDVGWRKLGQRLNVGSRHNEHVALEKRNAVQKGDNVIVLPDPVPRFFPSDDLAEDTARLDHVATFAHSFEHQVTRGSTAAVRVASSVASTRELFSLEAFSVPAQPPIYGIDLITDAVGQTVDPAQHRIVAIGLSLATRTERFDGPECDLIKLLDERLGALPAGVIATYNGSLLDLPLIAARAEMFGVATSLRLRTDRRAAPDSPILDLTEAICAAWGPHQHLDLRRFYSESSRKKRRGRLDPESLIPESNELTRRDPCKDAVLARRLTERRWQQARKFIDRMPVPAGDRVRTPVFVNASGGDDFAPHQATGTDDGASFRRRSTDR